MILRDDNRSIEQTWNMKKWYSFYTSYEDFGDAVNALSGQMDISSLKLQQVAAEIQETASEKAFRKQNCRNIYIMHLLNWKNLEIDTGTISVFMRMI